MKTQFITYAGTSVMEAPILRTNYSNGNFSVFESLRNPNIRLEFDNGTIPFELVNMPWSPYHGQRVLKHIS